MPDLRKQYRVTMETEKGTELYDKVITALSCYDALDRIWHDDDTPAKPFSIKIVEER